MKFNIEVDVKVNNAKAVELLGDLIRYLNSLKSEGFKINITEEDLNEKES